MAKEKTLVVIGGSSGIGLRTAQLAAARGIAVVIGGRDANRLDAALRTLPASARGTTVDATSSRSLQAFFQDLSQVDMLFTPGTSYAVGGFADSDEALARSPFEGKFWPQYWAAHAALEKLAPDASILLMAGAASARPIKGGAGYAAANAAIEGLARGLATELAPRRVNALSPGTVDSELWRGRPQALREQAYAHYRGATLLGQVAHVDDIAQAALFLLTNGFMTGSTLFADGGYALR
ncbi:short-chain dehydrogenase [Bordetella sp. N]|nr:short-chain dehydrogenase [Bordetella sp. N]